MFRRSLSLAVLASLLPAAAAASPPDVMETYTRTRAEVSEPGERIRDTPAFLATYLVRPSSPYSDLVAGPNDLNEIWWGDFTERLLGEGGDPEKALAVLQTAAGLTKARPGIDVVVTAEDVARYRGAEAAAGAIKAGIDVDIYNKALDHNDPRVTAAAGEAVALQILREQMARFSADELEARGIRADAFARVMAAPSASVVTEEDDRYLGDVLRQALEQPHTPADGLPTIYRLARTAASYSDRAGYYTSQLCEGTKPAAHMPMNYADALEYHSPLCFMAATDRGAHAWFREQVRLDAARAWIHENHHTGWSRLVFWLGAILPLADMISLFEFTNALVADDLVEAGGLDASEGEDVIARSNRLVCGAHKP